MSASQASKIALGTQRYLKPIPRPYNRNITEQLNEYYGLGSYHCKEHEILGTSLKSISEKYAKSSLEDKQKYAEEEVNAWFVYINSRKPQLPDTFLISDITRARLQRIWSHMLHREKDTVECSRLLDYHTRFIEHYSFEVPVDKRSMWEMVHPHAGYLIKMNREFTFSDMIDFYYVQLISSYERSLGEDLLSRQLSLFNYYRFIHQDQAFFLDLKRTNDLLVTLNFFEVHSLNEFQKKFQWTLKEFEGEFDGMTEENFFVRLAVFRKIFLDYNL